MQLLRLLVYLKKWIQLCCVGVGQDQKKVWGIWKMKRFRLRQFNVSKTEFWWKILKYVITVLLSLPFFPSVYCVEFCSKKLIWAVQKSSQLLFSDYFFGSGKLNNIYEIAVHVVNSATSFCSLDLTSLLTCSIYKPNIFPLSLGK